MPCVRCSVSRPPAARSYPCTGRASRSAWPPTASSRAFGLGAARIGFYLYNNADDVDRVIEAVR